MSQSETFDVYQEDREAIAQQKVALKTATDADAQDLRAIMSLPAGRRFIWRLLETTHLYQTSFGFGNDRANYLEGERSIGVQLLAKLHKHCFELYQQMERENRTAT